MDMAAQTWEQVLLADPNNTEALGGLARAAKLSGKKASPKPISTASEHQSQRSRHCPRRDHGQTQADHNAQLQQAGKLAQQGQYAQAMQIYRQIFGDTPPPGDLALAYYETEAATEEGRPTPSPACASSSPRTPATPATRSPSAASSPTTPGPAPKAASSSSRPSRRPAGGRSSAPVAPLGRAEPRQLRRHPRLSRAASGSLSFRTPCAPCPKPAAQPDPDPPAARPHPRAESRRRRRSPRRTAADNAAYKALNAKHLDEAEQRIQSHPRSMLPTTPTPSPAWATSACSRPTSAAPSASSCRPSRTARRIPASTTR